MRRTARRMEEELVRTNNKLIKVCINRKIGELRKTLRENERE